MLKFNLLITIEEHDILSFRKRRYEVARVDVVRFHTNASARREFGSRVRELNPDIVIDNKL